MCAFRSDYELGGNSGIQSLIFLDLVSIPCGSRSQLALTIKANIILTPTSIEYLQRYLSCDLGLTENLYHRLHPFDHLPLYYCDEGDSRQLQYITPQASLTESFLNITNKSPKTSHQRQ